MGAVTRWIASVALVAALGGTAFAAPQLAGRRSLPDGTVRFLSGSAELTPESVDTLQRLAKLLRQRPELDPVLLVGHADDRGAEETNVVLSKRRADSVREHLVRLGIRRTRLQTEGLGSADPLVSGSTDEARRTNRRVEVWVTPQGAVARVAKVERKVLSKEAAAPQWRDARVDMPLRRLAQVRTMKQSSSEIRFERKDHIALGPEALVVIFGSPTKTQRSRRSVKDVEVKRGSIFASLAEREGRTLGVETGAGRYAVQSEKARIDVRRRQKKKKRASTVSVFAGRSSVTNRGRTVLVKEGYGTRVQEGSPPEPPKPLPLPPEWTAATPLEVFAGDEIELAWTNASGVTGAEVQVGLQGDPDAARPVQLDEVTGDRKKTKFRRSGIYYVRLAGIDDRGVRGAPSVARRIVVLERPQADALGGDAVTAGPRQVRLVAPRGAALKIGAETSSAAVERVLIRPGRHVLPYTITATAGDVATGKYTFDVAPMQVRLQADAMTVGEVERHVVRFEVTSAGAPVEGLRFVAAPVAAPSASLKVLLGATSTLAACVCGAPEGALAVVDEGRGSYRAEVSLPTSRRRETTLRIVEPRGPVGMEVPIPPPRLVAAAPPPPRRDGLFIGASGGATLGHADAPSPLVWLEAGARWRLAESGDLDLSAAAGWTSRSEDVHAFPIVGRAALSYVFGAARLFAGVGGGVRFASPSDTAPAFAAFGGLGYAVGAHGELRVEGGYYGLGSTPDVDEELAGFGLTVGYRVGTWRQ